VSASAIKESKIITTPADEFVGERLMIMAGADAFLQVEIAWDPVGTLIIFSAPSSPTLFYWYVQYCDVLVDIKQGV
jgi:hypothetical protein